MFIVVSIIITMYLPCQSILRIMESSAVQLLKFVKGEGVAKGVRHMEMRMWYIRDEYAKGDTDLHFMNGVKIPTDKLTKLGTADEHRVFCGSILGHDLLDIKYLEQLYNN